MFAAVLDQRRRVSFPFSGRDRVFQDLLQQRTERQLGIVVVAEDDHAGLLLFKADHVILRPVAVPSLKKAGPNLVFVSNP
jgi:hypothetical protein